MDSGDLAKSLERIMATKKEKVHELCTAEDNYTKAGGQISYWEDVPRIIYDLVHAKSMGNRHRKLYKLYPAEMLALAELAITDKSIKNPAAWFAVVTAKAAHDTPLGKKPEHVPEGYDHFVAISLEWVRGVLFKIRELAQRVADKLGIEVSAFIYKQAWLGRNIERWAALACETHAMGKIKKSKVALFNWYCRNKDIPEPPKIEAPERTYGPKSNDIVITDIPDLMDWETLFDKISTLA